MAVVCPIIKDRHRMLLFIAWTTEPGGRMCFVIFDCTGSRNKFFEQFDDLRFEEQVVGTCAFPMYKPSFHASRKVNQPRRLSTEGQASHTRQPQVSF